VWPSKFSPPDCLSTMNVDETAIWVEMLCGYKGWAEGKTYSDNFARNEISGYMLPCLNIETLRNELGIEKLGHRLEIVTAILQNELTLMNPIIVSLNPNMSFLPVSSRESSGGYSKMEKVKKDMMKNKKPKNEKL